MQQGHGPNRFLPLPSLLASRFLAARLTSPRVNSHRGPRHLASLMVARTPSHSREGNSTQSIIQPFQVLGGAWT